MYDITVVGMVMADDIMVMAAATAERLTVRGLTVLTNTIPDLMIMVLLIMVAHTTIIPRHPIGITLPTNIGRSSSRVQYGR